MIGYTIGVASQKLRYYSHNETTAWHSPHQQLLFQHTRWKSVKCYCKLIAENAVSLFQVPVYIKLLAVKNLRNVSLINVICPSIIMRNKLNSEMWKCVRPILSVGAELNPENHNLLTTEFSDANFIIIIRFITQPMQPHKTYTMHWYTNKLHTKPHKDDKINLKPKIELSAQNKSTHNLSQQTSYHAHHSVHTWLSVPAFHTSL